MVAAAQLGWTVSGSGGFAPLRVADVMSQAVRIGTPSDRLEDVHARMRLGGFRHLPIVDAAGRLVGVVSDRDVQRAWWQGPDTEVAVFMSRHVEWIYPESHAREAAAWMLREKLGCLPVVDRDGKLAGIVTESDFLRLAHRALTLQEMAAAEED